MTGNKLVLRGDLAASSAVPWIRHRAELLNLKGWLRRESDTRICLYLAGPEALIDAMEVACILGPADVWIETIDRQKHSFNAPPQGFSLLGDRGGD